MEIQINKKLALSLSILFITVSVLGVPILFETLALINKVSVSSEIIVNLFMLNLESIISSLGSLIIAFGLFKMANKFELDKITWFTIGLIYGRYSLLLFLIVVIIQKRNLLFNLQKTLRIILILLIVAYVLNMASNYFMSHYKGTIFFPKILELNHLVFGYEFPTYLSILNILGNFFIITLNIVFAIKMNRWIQDFNFTKKSIWIISTLIFGLFTLLLFHKLVIIEKHNNAA